MFSDLPRLVAIETTNRCNAECEFCPNRSLKRKREDMSDELFQRIIADCRQSRVPCIELFLNGEPFMDPKLIDRLRLVRKQMPEVRLGLYTNAALLTESKRNALRGLGLDYLSVSLNTLDPQRYQRIMGLNFEITLNNFVALAEAPKRYEITKALKVRMTRYPETTRQEMAEFKDFAQRYGAEAGIVSLFNYKGDITSALPVPAYPCEHIERLDILSNGKVALCCMDQEGAFSWGDLNRQSLKEVFNGVEAQRFRLAHRFGLRKLIAPCNTCNMFHIGLAAQQQRPLGRFFSWRARAYYRRFDPDNQRG